MAFYMTEVARDEIHFLVKGLIQDVKDEAITQEDLADSIEALVMRLVKMDLIENES